MIEDVFVLTYTTNPRSSESDDVREAVSRDGQSSGRYVQDPKLIVVSTEKSEFLALRIRTRLFTTVAEPSLEIYSSTQLLIFLINICMPPSSLDLKASFMAHPGIGQRLDFVYRLA